ncbi:PadR family transcriptional regulator [Bacillus sp. FJAT-27986]|uniref:PadR family transcriptional regulator n=1 Tax=Bacillus sp. FJAT-27986 TaxID=1743146 RepID=UPI00080AEEB0|nr:PadR family transcriptional regulator [Bacillus sp. FJAT-27986]OCA80753.1 hypothetical protein A8L44_16430 [Bacillus sp. FJAT-27986]
MEERLKGLKKAMKETCMRELDFSETMKKRIHKSIAKESFSEQDMFINLLQLLLKERTGFELTRLLAVRGIRKYEDEEGSIYAFLHEQELAGIITASWGSSGEKKYQLTDKGRRALEKSDERVWLASLTLRGQAER